jgi:hypothetical protein
MEHGLRDDDWIGPENGQAWNDWGWLLRTESENWPTSGFSGRMTTRHASSLVDAGPFSGASG